MHQLENGNILLTIAEVGKLVGVTASSVRDHIKRNRIRVVYSKVNGRSITHVNKSTFEMILTAYANRNPIALELWKSRRIQPRKTLLEVVTLANGR